MTNKQRTKGRNYALFFGTSKPLNKFSKIIYQAFFLQSYGYLSNNIYNSDISLWYKIMAWQNILLDSEIVFARASIVL